MAYCSQGAFPGPNVMDMDADDRRFYIKRLAQQIAKEEKAAKVNTRRGGSRARR